MIKVFSCLLTAVFYRALRCGCQILATQAIYRGCECVGLFLRLKKHKKQILVLVMPRESFYIISRLMMTRFYFAEVPIVEKNRTR